MPTIRNQPAGKLLAVVGESAGRPTVNLCIRGIKVVALVDTGASCNLLRRDIFDMLVAKTHRSAWLAPAPELLGVNGSPLDICGTTEISVNNVPVPITVYVAKHIPHDMILGDPSLRRGCGNIDLYKNELSWFSRMWPLRSHKRSGYGSIGPIAPVTGDATFDQLVKENYDVFSAKGEPTGQCGLTELRIKTRGAPICQKAYRTPLTKRKLIDDAIREMLEDGVIRPSSSPWASPVTLVPKKDGSIRFCVDYRKLNSITEKDTYPLPLIQDIFDQVGGSRIYSTMDLKAGYWQLPVAEDDIPKTAFRCHRGLFEFVRMPFGLANAPAVFQRVMDKLLSGLIGKCVLVYLDDIVVYSNSAEDHEKHLQLVFDRLRQAGLRLKPTKCHFGLSEVKLLGYILNGEGIQTDPEKVAAINNLATPTSVSEVRSFLGMSGYYRQCIPDYAQVAEPLVALTRKFAQFTWSEERQKAFDILKSLLTSSHVMAAPRTDQPYKLYTDACDYAVGGILVQVDENGVERVIQYVSHALSSTQRRWAVIEKEAYAVIYVIQKLRPYLYGSKFTVYTDHKPLKSLFNNQMNNTKIQRWAVLLAEYGAVIEYRKGKHNIRADMLSRIRHRQDPEIAVIDTEDWIDPNAFPEDETAHLLPLLHDGLRLEVVREEQQQEFPDLWTRAQDEEDDDYELIQGTLYSMQVPNQSAPEYPRLVLPAAYRESVIDRAHREVGHMAVLKTMWRITEAYVWPGLRKDIRMRLRKCGTCVIHNRHPEHAPPGEMPIASYPMQIVGADLIGPLVETPSGNRYALTIIDHCSGWAEAFPLRDKTNQSVWDAFTNGFLARHGVPEVLITDNGGEFTALEWERYLKQLGIDHHRTTPVHPQSNGRTERFNRTLKEMLQKLVNNASEKWESQLNTALLAYRTSVSTTTGYTPFYLLYGRRSRMPLTKTLRVANEDTFGNRLDELARALQVARVATEESRKFNRRRLEQRANARDVRVGDTVVVKADDRVSFTSRWDPQWEVTRVSGPVVRVRHQQSGRIRTVNREKVRITDPTICWDDYTPRPPRAAPRRQVRYQPPRAEADNQPPILAEDNQQPALAADDQQPPPIEDNQPPTMAEDNDSQSTSSDEDETPPPPRTPTYTEQRPGRSRQLTEKARLVADDFDSDNLIGRHYRKRQRSPAQTQNTGKRNKPLYTKRQRSPGTNQEIQQIQDTRKRTKPLYIKRQRSPGPNQEIPQPQNTRKRIKPLYTKRQRSPAPNQEIQKRARCEAIALVSLFC